MLVQSPSAVPSIQVRTWSMAAEAADAAEEEPRALMTAAPRCCTVGMNCSSIHFWSTRLLRGLAFDVRVADVRILGGGVVAPDRQMSDVVDMRAGLLRQLRQSARL